MSIIRSVVRPMVRAMVRGLTEGIDGFSPLSLFAGGANGFWYDPADLRTMYQDSAGTTAVYMPGQGSVDPPVGKILDKSGNGNHATQSTSTARPKLSARYNMLTYNADLSNAAWTPTRTVSSATHLIPSTDNDTHYTQQGTVALGSAQTIVVRAKADGYRWLKLVSWTDYANFDLVDGVVGVNHSSESRSITDLGGGVYECRFDYIAKSAASGQGCIMAVTGSDNASYNPTVFAGDGTSGIEIISVDLRLTAYTHLPAVQSITDANTYDTSGFPLRLAFDGVDDFMSIASLDMTATDAVTVFAGVTKLTSTGAGIVCETSVASIANNGAMALLVNATADNIFAFRSSVAH